MAGPLMGASIAVRGGKILCTGLETNCREADECAGRALNKAIGSGESHMRSDVAPGRMSG